MNKVLSIVLSTLLQIGVFTGIIQAQDAPKNWKDNLSFNLITASDFAYGFQNGQLQKAEIIFKPEVKYQLHKNVKLVGIGRWYLEATDHLEPGWPNQEAYISALSRRQLLGDRMELELREFYVQARIKKKWYVRLGKQQVVWGETDGLKLLDVVNPQYFREFVLDAFEDSRIPLWSLKVDFPIGKKLKSQFLWIPDQSYHALPDFQAPFFPGSVIPTSPEGVMTRLQQTERPNHWFSDSDLGLKIATFIKGWDLSFHYLYHYDDLPVLYQHLDQTDSGMPVVDIYPRYKRQHLAGMTFNKPVGSTTLRGELAYTFSKPFSTLDKQFSEGIASSDYLQLALGLDYLPGEWIISPQIFNELLIHDIPAFNRDRYEINISLLISRELFNDSFKAEVIWVQSLNRGDGMIRPSFRYWLRSDLELLLGADIFYGKKNGLLGQFSDVSRMSVGFIFGV